MMRSYLILLMVTVFVSCKTHYIAVPEYHTVYQTKTDSLVQRDSIRVPFPVEKSLTKMEMLRMKLGSVVGIVIIAGIIVFILKLYLK